MADVKPRRRYDSTRRGEQARQTRAEVVEAASRLFLSDGYAATTVAAIAAAASVSVETIYKAFGGKPGLVRAIRDRALAGTGPVHAERRSDRLQEGTVGPRAIIEGWGTLTTEVSPLVSPILLLVRQAAGADPELAQLEREMDEARLARMTHNARSLHDRGHLRAGLTLEDAAVVLWLYTSADVYQLLVLRQGWSVARYSRFVSDSIAAALLPAT